MNYFEWYNLNKDILKDIDELKRKKEESFLSKQGGGINIVIKKNDRVVLLEDNFISCKCAIDSMIENIESFIKIKEDEIERRVKGVKI